MIVQFISGLPLSGFPIASEGAGVRLIDNRHPSVHVTVSRHSFIHVTVLKHPTAHVTTFCTYSMMTALNNKTG